jgi:hypothetical protein
LRAQQIIGRLLGRIGLVELSPGELLDPRPEVEHGGLDLQIGFPEFEAGRDVLLDVAEVVHARSRRVPSRSSGRPGHVADEANVRIEVRGEVES